MILSNVALKNRTTVAVLTLLIVVIGTISFVTLPRKSAPDVPVPIIMISTPYDGVSPEDVESSITMKIEEKLTGLRGVKEIRSNSREGLSFITVEFNPDVKADEAMQYVRDKVDLAKAELPREAEEPSLMEVNVAEFPIMMVNISGAISPVTMKAMADELQDALEAIPGVLEVNMSGDLEREIRLEFDPDRLAGYGISVAELMTLIPSENVNISAGGLDTAGTKFNIRVPAEFADPADVDHLPLTVRDGKTIYLTDVAQVRDTFKDRASYARLDGKPTITLAIKKRIGQNIIDIAEQVQMVLAEARKRVPAGVDVLVTADQSEDIHRMVSDLENHMLSGLVLVVGVLMIFLGLRTSMIVALAIPLSMLISLAVLQAMGVTLNMVVLFSLILALGMLVDDAIVIVENIYRYMQMGHSKIEAAMKGTSEVAWPVITSTLTNIAAFAPMLFWPGIMGEFMSYLPLTVIVVLSASLFVAMVINPVAALAFAKVHGEKKEAHQKHRIQLTYKRLLMVALKSPWTSMALSVILLVCVAIIYVKFGYGSQFFPEPDPKRAIINIRAPQGTSLQYSDQLARLVEQRIESQRPYMDYVVATVGGEQSAGKLGGDGGGGPHISNITMVFPNFEKRTKPSKEVVKEVRAMLADIPGVEIKVAAEKGGPPTGAAVTIRIAGDDFATLAQLSRQAQALIVNVPGLVNLRSDYEASRPELQFQVDRRRAMLLGVNTAIVGNFLKTSVFGAKVGTYRQFNDEYDITVRLPVDERLEIDNLFRLHVPDRQGDAVPLSSLGEFTYAGGFGDINRVNRNRVITLSADAEGRESNEVLADVQKILSDEKTGLSLPEGYGLTYVGEKEESDKAKAFLSKAFIIGLLAITLILVTQFNTLSVPLIIMSTVPLSLIGVGIGLLVTHTPFGVIMTGIGVISLAGVVVKNAIVMLDYTRQLQRRGLDVIEACAEAGMTRLRPVFLTAVTAMLGLVPMATGISFNFLKFQWETKSESSEWWSAMANAVIFGLGFATLLTLVVVPVMYAMAYRFLEKRGLGGLHKYGEAVTADVPHEKSPAKHTAAVEP